MFKEIDNRPLAFVMFMVQVQVVEEVVVEEV